MPRLKVSWRRRWNRGRCGFAHIASCPTTGTSCFGRSMTETWPPSCSNSPPSTCDVGSCTAGEWAMGTFTRAGTSRFRSRKKSISISLCVTWSATRCGQVWSSAPRHGSGPAFGDGPRGTPEQKQLLSAWPVPYPRGWCKLVNEPQTEAEVEAIRRCVARGQPYGGEDWVRRTAEQLGLESTLRAPHRPKKVAGKP